jgi:hypothetical protein
MALVEPVNPWNAGSKAMLITVKGVNPAKIILT